MENDSHILSQKELEIRLYQLEKEYELATRGLNLDFAAIRFMAVLIAASTLTLLLIKGLSLIAAIKDWISGFQVAAIIIVTVLSILAYFALVFGRAAKIRAEISQTKKRIEIEVGKKVR